MKEYEIYEKMLEVMTPKNWTKGTLFDGNSSCLIGHAIRASRELLTNSYEVEEDDGLHINILRDVIKEKYNKTLMMLNDMPETLFEDIVDVVELAYKKAWDNEEKEMNQKRGPY